MLKRCRMTILLILMLLLQTKREIKNSYYWWCYCCCWGRHMNWNTMILVVAAASIRERIILGVYFCSGTKYVWNNGCSGRLVILESSTCNTKVSCFVVVFFLVSVWRQMFENSIRLNLIIINVWRMIIRKIDIKSNCHCHCWVKLLLLLFNKNYRIDPTIWNCFTVLVCVCVENEEKKFEKILDKKKFQ